MVKLPKLLQLKLFRDLKSSKWQFLAVTMVVVLGITLFGALYMSYMNLKTSYNRSFDVLNLADFTVKVRNAPIDVIDTIKHIPSVKGAIGRISVDVGLDMPRTKVERVTGRIISIPAGKHSTVNDIVVIEGSYFSENAMGDVLLEKRFAEYHHYEPGDMVYPVINGEEIGLRVMGVVTSPEYIWVVRSSQDIMPSPRTFGVLFVPEAQVQQMLGLKDLVNEISITVKNSAERQEIIDKVEKILKPYGVLETVKKEKQPSTEMLEMDVKAFGQLAVFFPILFLIIAGMTMYILLSRMVHAQRQQIGLMLATGYSKRSVMLHYLSFSLLVGMVGSLVGSLVGYYLSGELTRLWTGFYNIPFLVIEPDWGIIGAGIVLGVVFCSVAGAVPAWSSTKLSPAESMRSEGPITGKTSLIELLLPFLSRLSNTWKIPLRNIFRSRWRTFSTAIGVTFAISLILVSVSFFDSFNAMLDVQFNKVQVYDMKVIFTQFQTKDVASEIGTWNGVNKAEPVLEVPVRLKHGYLQEIEHLTTLVGLPPHTDLYNLPDTSGSITSTSRTGVVLSSVLKEKLNLEFGDVFDLELLLGVMETSKEVGVRVAGFVKPPFGSMVFMPLHQVQRILDAPDAVTGVMLDVDADAVNRIEKRLYDLPSTAFVEVTAQTKREIDDMLKFFYSFIGVMLGSGTAMASAITFNTVTINILERRRELATMRTLGTSRRKIAAIVTIENMLTGLFGVIPGIFLGQLLAKIFISTYASEMFTMDAWIFPETYMLTIVGILLILLLSEIPGIRYINHLDLARVTKERVT